MHERDIERMCNKNYQGFIESVSELLKVKTDAMKLKVCLCTRGEVFGVTEASVSIEWWEMCAGKYCYYFATNNCQ